MLRMCVFTGTGFSPYAQAFFDLRSFFSSVIGWRLIPRENLAQMELKLRRYANPANFR